jgi:sugar phosphate isomerase/epimerase
MELGLCIVCLMDRKWEEALDYLRRHDLRTFEPCGGGHIPKKHYDPQVLAKDRKALDAFKDSVESRGLKISSLACHGNPLHPDPARRKLHHDDFVASCQIARHLGVTVVDTLAGCPGGGPHDKAPNWIINSIFPEFRAAYEWQWSQCAIPYWRDAAKIAGDCGVKIAIEPIGGSLVYNAETFLRLRQAAGPAICANVDPSHLFWQGIDVEEMVLQLGSAIALVHAKDVKINNRLVSRDGLIPSVDYADWTKRSWGYCTIGFGHDRIFWSGFLKTLRHVGYDGPVIIEVEDPFLTVEETVEKSIAFLRELLPVQPVPQVDYFKLYEWSSPKVD